MGATHRILTETQWAVLCDLVLHQAGIRLQPQQRSQVDWAIQIRLRETAKQDLDGYLKWLQDDRQEFLYFIDLITVQETFFFRYKGQFDALAKILKEIAEHNSLIRIWSCGCATGEEPYSIAITAREALKEDAGKVKIMASDISYGALKKAAEGKFHARAVREVPPHLLSKYFRKEGKQYVLEKSIKHSVHFFYHNLRTDPYPGALWIIFCRNVTIYFERDTTYSILRSFHRSLLPGGYLFLGHAESLFGHDVAFRALAFPNCFVYQKGEQEKEKIEPGKVGQQAPAERVRSVEAACVPAPGEGSREEPFSALLKSKDRLETIRLWEKENFKRSAPFEVLKKVGTAYADLGQLEQARPLLERACELNSLDYDLHFLLSVIYETQGELDEAHRSIKRALYLDPKQPSAFFQLGKICEQKGKLKEARQAYKNALIHYWQEKDQNRGKDMEEVLLQKLFRLRKKERYG